MNRWNVHFVITAVCIQMGCQPEKKPTENQSESPKEIDGTRLVRLGPRVHVAPAFTGTAVWKYPNGNRHTARTFKNGILEGPMVSWYDDGQTKQYSVIYKANKKNGVATGYYRNGAKKFEISYTNGVRNNVEMWWHGNGQKQFEYEWSHGKRLKASAWDNKGGNVALPKPKPRVPLKQSSRKPLSKANLPSSKKGSSPK